MRRKYKTVLILIALLFVMTLGIGIDYILYEPENNDTSLVSVVNDISINYLNGQEISTKEEALNVDFSITNNSLQTKEYTVYLLNVKNTSSLASYRLVSDLTKTKTQYFANHDERILNKVKIDSNETHFYTIKLDNPDMKNLQFKIYVEVN